MCSIHRETSFRRLQVIQECLQAMKRSLDLQRGVLASVMEKVSTFRPEAPAIERNCDSVLSSSWPLPIVHFPASMGFQCCRAFGAEGDSWYWMSAHGILTATELATWLRLPGTRRRRREWLLGRFAAKDAVRLFLKSQHALEICPADIEIITGKHGQPVVVGEPIEKVGSRLSISIAHSGWVALAIAGDCGDYRGVGGVGVDVERVDQNLDNVARIALTQKERLLLSPVPASRRNEWLLRLWCAKEAVAKALGRGMASGPLSLEVQNIEENVGNVDIMLVGEVARQLPGYADMALPAYTGREGAYVFASSLIN